MITRLITVLRQPANEVEGTGTFADGVFPLTLAERSSLNEGHNLRSSYERDYLAARKLAAAPVAYA